ncbi:hypothetical protein C2G38_2083561 [Gigaspora rosea]|uniref:Membrane anchor Opy2 N-terminal domain-containing protein n=1 Tax=Gigaspora rosea TaxID=44941 RepID=A0A397V9Z8_9GLOM|nr:hypothetical protein C2G38_2083561 [Gigaspora rosea]
MATKFYFIFTITLALFLLVIIDHTDYAFAKNTGCVRICPLIVIECLPDSCPDGFECVEVPRTCEACGHIECIPEDEDYGTTA